MLIWTILRVALRSLLINKMRLFLTMLGIIIGVGAVIAMLALAEGAQRSVLERFDNMGVNLLTIRPNWGRRGSFATGDAQTLTLDDWRAVEQQMADYVRHVAPEAWDGVTARRGNRSSRIQVSGSTPSYFYVRNFTVADGRVFTDQEVAQQANVCVIGPKVVEDLFQGEDPINQEIYLGRRRMTVIGVTEPKGDQGWFNPDNQAFAPLTTVMNEIIGQTYLDAINVACVDRDLINECQAGLMALMERRKGAPPPGAEPLFRVDSMAQLQAEVETATGVFKLLLGGIAGISLLVGGIGIMNIMLVTVTERTREIGVRKALGARRRDILSQFLIEAVFIACVGGGLGIALGWGVAHVFNNFVEQFKTVVTADSILMAVSCSTAIGLVFGIYPAQRAAKLDPIEALRHE